MSKTVSALRHKMFCRLTDMARLYDVDGDECFDIGLCLNCIDDRQREELFDYGYDHTF